MVTSAINPHTSANKPIASWGQKSPLVSHHHNVQSACFMWVSRCCVHEPRLQMGHFSLSWQITVLQHWTGLTAGIPTGTTARSVQPSLLYCSTFCSRSALPLEASAMACHYFVLALRICGRQSHADRHRLFGNPRADRGKQRGGV